MKFHYVPSPPAYLQVYDVFLLSPSFVFHFYVLFTSAGICTYFVSIKNASLSCKVMNVHIWRQLGLISYRKFNKVVEGNNM